MFPTKQKSRTRSSSRSSRRASKVSTAGGQPSMRQEISERACRAVLTPTPCPRACRRGGLFVFAWNVRLRRPLIPARRTGRGMADTKEAEAEITLETYDKHHVKVPKSIATRSAIINMMIEGKRPRPPLVGRNFCALAYAPSDGPACADTGDTNEVVPLADKSCTLSIINRVVDYLKKHAEFEATNADDEVRFSPSCFFPSPGQARSARRLLPAQTTDQLCSSYRCLRGGAAHACLPCGSCLAASTRAFRRWQHAGVCTLCCTALRHQCAGH